MQTVFDLLKRGRGDPSPTVGKRCKSVGDGAFDVPRITIKKRREQAFKCRKRRVSPLTGFVTPPYRFAPFLHRWGGVSPPSFQQIKNRLCASSLSKAKDLQTVFYIFCYLLSFIYSLLSKGDS